ncbi:hypothetical protein P3X46_013570 [Hevea brasiliensis]|uniref:Exostosin GT47 domain-containing protein n=1 Tax=Hevea brasiliensis TaxID=3981 RepID=A0ABQ9M7V6_HEVBR|nr:hypothetical protein P3X46_013570 [Hevea brasiliensis]
MKGNSTDYTSPFAEVLHSPIVFDQNYARMERDFKVFEYPEAEPSMYFFALEDLRGQYASEGHFFHNLRASIFLTDDPDKAHLFFIPISCQIMAEEGYSHQDMDRTIKNYIKNLISEYPYWNRTLGADHFLVACHDIGLNASSQIPQLEKNSIRVVCSSNYRSRYIPHKDVALPQIVQPFALPAGEFGTENRTKLGLYVGSSDTKVGRDFIEARKNDPEFDIWHTQLDNDPEFGIWKTQLDNDPGFENRSTQLDEPRATLFYVKKFYKAKFCICHQSSGTNSACVAESIHSGCVPVIMSEYYDFPFNDIINWKKFSIIVKEEDVYHLKEILKAISDEKYLELQKNTVKVQRLFEWNSSPMEYDTFHMVMYELWLRRHAIKY